MRQGIPSEGRKGRAYHYSTQAVLASVATRCGDVGREIQITERVADSGWEFPSVLVLPGKPEMKIWMIFNDPQLLFVLWSFLGGGKTSNWLTQHLKKRSVNVVYWSKLTENALNPHEISSKKSKALASSSFSQSLKLHLCITLSAS